MLIRENPSRVFPFLLVFLFFVSTSLYGQFDSLRSSSSPVLHKRPDVFRFADGVVYTYSAPARWNVKEWLMLGGLIVGTSGVSFFDHPVRNFWRRHDNRFLDGVERIGYHYGKPYTAVGITTGLYLSGMIFKSEWAKETGLLLGTSIFSSSLLMGTLKKVAGRARPGPEGNMEFRPFHESAAFHAFPSGHSSVAFGISLILAKRVNNVPLKVLFYSLAGTTAVGRMYADQHWVSDVAFGGMLAWFCADTALSRLQANRFRTAGLNNRMVWQVFPYPGGLTLRASIR